MFWIAVYLFLALFGFIAALLVLPFEHLRIYQQSHKPWEYYLAGALCISIPIVGALETILSPGHSPTTWRLYGVMLYVGGHALVNWAHRVNPYFVPALEKPRRIVTEGPYQFCRHPGYMGFTLASMGTVIMLASSWAIVPLLAYWGLLFHCVERENKLLYE